jgi:hypothetical protein
MDVADIIGHGDVSGMSDDRYARMQDQPSGQSGHRYRFTTDAGSTASPTWPKPQNPLEHTTPTNV